MRASLPDRSSAARRAQLPPGSLRKRERVERGEGRMMCAEDG